MSYFGFPIDPSECNDDGDDVDPRAAAAASSLGYGRSPRNLSNFAADNDSEGNYGDVLELRVISIKPDSAGNFVPTFSSMVYIMPHLVNLQSRTPAQGSK